MTENENQPGENEYREVESESLEIPSDDQGVEFGDPVTGDETDIVLQLQDQLKEAEKRVLMAQADLENFRRRVRRESQDQIKYASAGLMTDLLEPVDNLHRAIDAYRLDPNGDGLRDGVNLVLGQIKETLTKHGCKPIDAAGQPFDPNRHQALQMQPSDEWPANTVMQDLRPGFQLHDRVLRPSQVFVSTGPA